MVLESRSKAYVIHISFKKFQNRIARMEPIISWIVVRHVDYSANGVALNLFRFYFITRDLSS